MTDRTLSRRQFILQLTMASAAVVVATAGCSNNSAPSAAPAPSTPAAGQSGATSASAGPVSVGKTSDFQQGDFKKVALASGSNVYVTKTSDGYLALSAKCTHRGCDVLWMSAQKIFRCPCHGGTFDAQGTNTSGPPKSPLPTLTTSVQGDTVYVAA